MARVSLTTKLSDHWPTVTLGGKENMEQPESNESAERASGSLERMVRCPDDLNPDTVGWINGEEKQHDKCCGFMDMAIKCALIRTNHGLRFGPDVLPSPLTTKIVACPWCGAKTPNSDYQTPVG